MEDEESLEASALVSLKEKQITFAFSLSKLKLSTHYTNQAVTKNNQISALTNLRVLSRTKSMISLPMV